VMPQLLTSSCGGLGMAWHFRIYRLGKLRDNCLCS
jgi:hypothetical protein